MTDILKHFEDTYDRENAFYTHVTVNEPRGKWSLQRHKIFTFWEQYNNEYEDKDMTIAERPQEYSMLVSDVDYSSPFKTKLRHLYGDKDIFAVTQAYQESIKFNVENATPKSYETIVLIKKPYLKTTEDKRLRSVSMKKVVHTNISHGFHLAFPNIFVNSLTRKAIRETAQSILVENNSKVVLDNIDNKPWLLYGSCKSVKSGRYEAAFVLDHNMEKLYLEDWLETYTCFDSKEDKYIPEMEDLPKVLSIFPFGRKTSRRKEILSSIGYNVLTNERKIEFEDIEFDEGEFEENLDTCKGLINKISPVYADDRDAWRSIGCALHTVLFGQEEGLELFLSFSENSSKFDRATCENEWSRFNGHYTLGTLIHYFKLSNVGCKRRKTRK